jgi:uncharacterized repeat protein (TIGR01451 family)
MVHSRGRNRIVRMITANAVAALIVGLAVSGVASASGEIELQTTAHQEVQVVDDSGQQLTKLTTASKVVPGGEVIYTITARNVSDQPVESVVIDDPIPLHMIYVEGSAVGEGTTMTFSVDGGASFHPAEELTIVDEAGTARPAEPKDLTDIRWTLDSPMPPSVTKSVRFRARLQ